MTNLEVKKTQIKLANGSVLVHIFLPQAHSNVITAFVKAGYRFDPKNFEGLAHFMEHMTLSGTKKYPNSVELHTSIEEYGALYYAFTSEDYAYFSIEFAGDGLEKMVDNLAERLVRPLFKKEDIEETKGNILQELSLNKTNPQRHIWDLWQETIWQETLLSRNYLGMEKSLSSINRESLLNFYHRYCGIDNTIFFYAGYEERDKVERLFYHYFKDYQQVSPSDFVKLIPERKNPLKIFWSAGEQITFAFGFKTEGIYSPDYHVLELLRVILGLGWSCRLVKNLFLKDGLIYTWFMNFSALTDNGYLMFQSACSKKNINKVLEIIVKEFKKIKDNYITAEELEKAKRYYESNLLLKTQTPPDFIHWYAEQELFLPDSVEDINDRIKKIKKITKEDIMQVAQKYFTDNNWYLALIGNVKRKEILIPAF